MSQVEDKIIKRHFEGIARKKPFVQSFKEPGLISKPDNYNSKPIKPVQQREINDFLKSQSGKILNFTKRKDGVFESNKFLKNQKSVKKFSMMKKLKKKGKILKLKMLEKSMKKRKKRLSEFKRNNVWNHDYCSLSKKNKTEITKRDLKEILNLRKVKTRESFYKKNPTIAKLFSREKGKKLFVNKK